MEQKTRYSAPELAEFKAVILVKMADAKESLQELRGEFKTPTEKESVLEDGAATLHKETSNQLADRQKKFIRQLENALVRIENKTYGICVETGKLIPKGRLLAVPHTTMTMEAKLKEV